MRWEKVIAKVIPYIFKIETPAGNGTGFLCHINTANTFCTLATALHVIDYANTWRQPIHLIHYHSGQPTFVPASHYVIFPDKSTDSAIILFKKPNFDLPSRMIELLPTETPLALGNNVGWLGFPAIEPNTLCFFCGSISAWQESRKAYLIDGVAINGVSGGPVIFRPPSKEHQIVGIVSAYRANRVTGETLPGLLYAQDVSHFHNIINQIRSLEEAQQKKQEVQQQINKTPPNTD